MARLWLLQSSSSMTDLPGRPEGLVDPGLTVRRGFQLESAGSAAPSGGSVITPSYGYAACIRELGGLMAAPAGSDETRDRAENPTWLRLLAASQGEPRALRRIPPLPRCAACGGSGKRELDETGGGGPAQCFRCKGTGSEPKPIPRP